MIPFLLIMAGVGCFLAGFTCAIWLTMPKPTVIPTPIYDIETDGGVG